MYLISILIAKTINKISNLLKIGSGNTWSGHVALMLHPNIWKEVESKLPKEVVMISGTNGKTTTAKLLTHILASLGKRVLHNSSGANLLNGVLSSILVNSSLDGNLNYDVAVFEVDEATLPSLHEVVKPNILGLLNLSRDQLDRHWETDLVYLKWEEMLLKSDSSIKLILDEYQEEFKGLKSKYKGEMMTFDKSDEGIKRTSLLGEFNAKNVNCALVVAGVLNVSREDALKSLQTFEYAYGRGESRQYKNKEYRVLLAKNPESLNQNLKLLNTEQLDYDTLIYVLNDNVPDGHDVSWIYDIDPLLIEKASKNKKIYVSGVRALDMAIRLRYAGVNLAEEDIVENVKEIFERVTKGSSEKIVVLPNYSAMLETRKVIVGRKIL